MHPGIIQDIAGFGHFQKPRGLFESLFADFRNFFERLAAGELSVRFAVLDY